MELDGSTVRRFLVGDVLAILAFVALGEVQHGVPPTAFPIRFAATAVPFLAGWVVAALPAGAYAARAGESVRSAALRAFAAWLAADAVAQLVRGTAVVPGEADPVFYVVAAAFGGGFLVAWRAVAVLAARHTEVRSHRL